MGKALQTAQLLLVVLPAFVLFGYNQSGVGGLLSLKDWNHHFPGIDVVDAKGAEKSHKSTIQGAVVATFTIGALFGALSCSWVGDVLGRRKVVFGAAVLTLIGEILQCTSFQLAQFISECSSAANRGKHVVLDGCFISLGYFLEAWINLGFFEVDNGPLQWRIPLAIPCLISMMLMASTFSIPESPRWLVRKGRTEQARASLSAFKQLPSDDPEISAEISGIELTLEETSRGAAKLSDIFTMGEDKLFYRFALCIFLQFLQQMCGSNLISTYSTIIFQQGLGMNAEISRALSGGALTWKFFSCFVAFFTIDRFGRRNLFMFSGVGMASCMLALAVASSFPKSNKPAQIASALFVFLFNFFIPICFLGANFLYCTEVAPTRLRVPMAGISTANHWLWNFVINMVTPVAIDTIGWKYYLVFMIISVTIVPVVFFAYPETMRRSLEELEMLFVESETIREVVKESRKPLTGTGLLPRYAMQKKLGEKDDKVECKE
ncbi:and other transporter-domain-containing protein [Clohesyomyces aquaticus]|uniref:And other transporter-domain-containing protein n=1 Tax=Clohesyomyces aquaticus TaxID=1231657 RepID=A0A1Y1ZFJ1_9PLEO|nr:and other transporter-domain-containing protein [Clohesyomyces aquaticus]